MLPFETLLLFLVTPFDVHTGGGSVLSHIDAYISPVQ